MLLKKFGIWFLAIEQNDLIVFQMKSEKISNLFVH